jgi:PiT family inorganic phosphate transporter
MTPEVATVLAGAGAFAAVTGANDGGAMVAVARSVRGLSPASCLVILLAAVLATPVLLGTAVAQTFTTRLADFGSDGRPAFLAAVLATVAVIWVLAVLGLPTSISLALVGAVAGAGTALGVSVDWAVVGAVLALAAVAPLAGAMLARFLVRTSRWVPVPEGLPLRVRWLHAVAFALLCVAYGANDGQKMLAVTSVAYAVSVPEAARSPVVLGVVSAGFLAGSLVGYHRVARTLGGAVVPLAPEWSVTAELASASVVLGTSVLGSPVSLTQAVSGALVGAGAAVSQRRVRWRAVSRLAGAWAVTLPASLLVGASAALVAAGGPWT